MQLTPEHLAAILGMALVTYATRAAGYWWIARRPVPARLRRLLEVVPGAVLVAVIAPAMLASGWPGALAGAVTVIAAWRLPRLAVVAVAVLAAAASRALTG